MNRNIRLAIAFVSVMAYATAVPAEGDDAAVVDRPTLLPLGKTFSAQDSLDEPHDDRPDAQACLNGLCWPHSTFAVTCEAALAPGADALIRFPSARPGGDEQNDRVAAEWYAVTDAQGRPATGPAMVVIHESGRGMTVGRMMAQGFRERGIHAFMVQLPFYGLRRAGGARAEDHDFAEVMSQGIADARRTRDAIAVLPGIDPGRISLQGTSLGGFVSATAAGLGPGFDHVFILLAGGNLPELITTGARETAQLKDMLARKGLTGDSARELLNRFEPNRLAHRIDPQRLWLYSAMYDTVVPPAHPDSFAKATALDASHHYRMPANHYSGVIFLPAVLNDMALKAGGQALKMK